jgi:RNA polymerase sigma-70 factor (ECF subfamily)
MQEASDDELMRLSGTGDRLAFQRLVARHVRRASALAGRVTGNRSDAEEAVQEAFLRAWLKAPDWQARDALANGAAFATWFNRVLVNLCIDRVRRPQADPIEAAAAVPDAAPNAEALTAGGEIARRISRAMAELPERQRAALALCHFEGLSNAEAGQILELSVGAVESLLVRARRTLREKLADLAPHEAVQAARSGAR